MESSQSSLQEYHEQTEEEEYEDEDEDGEEERVNTISQQTQVGHLGMKKCKGAHVGHTSIFRRPVKMKTVWKIKAPNSQGSSISTEQPVSFNHGSLHNQLKGGGRPFRFPSMELSTLPEENYIGPYSGNFLNQVTDVQERSSNPSILTEGSGPNSHVTISEVTTEHNDDASEETALISENNGVVWSRRKSIICYGAALIIVVIIVIALILWIVLYYKLYPHDQDNLPMNFTERLITRGQWFAFPPKTQIKPFKYNPVPFVVVCHTAGTTCYDKQSCRVLVRNIQGGQMSRNFYDISYNYLVGGNGYIYEGRGWDEASAGTPPMDCSALSIGFIGNFVVDVPPLKQMNAFRLILDAGVQNGKLDKQFKMFMQKQIVNVESPGEALIEILTGWQHWKPFNKEDLICSNNTKS